MGIRFFLFFLLGTLFAPFAFAAAPTCNGTSEGTIVYNKDHKIMQFCDGVEWIGMSGLSAGTIDTLSSLSCANNEIAKWNGTTWACAADAAGSGGVTALTGEVTASGTGAVAATIANNAITNAKMADDAVGIAELSATGTAGTATFLRGDNTWTSIQSSVWLSDGPEGPAEIYYNGGNVGIGVNNPDVRLEVYGGIISETDEANGTAVNGTSWPTTGTTLGGYFASHSPAGRAIYARNFGTTGNAYGGSFDSDSISGVGVSGRAGGTGGDFSASSTTGRAVYGRATAASGSTYAGYFYVDSPTGTAVHGWAPGTTGANKGGHFSAGGSSGIGVFAEVGHAGGIAIVARGAASQTANIQEWRSNSNSVIASVNSSGVFTGDGSGLTALNAANLASGTVPTARLGTGTANGATYLRGDNTWATVPSGADNLGNHTASTNIILGTNWLSGDGGAEGIKVDSSGSVGIATSTPEAKLHVAGGGTGNILLDNTGSILAKDTAGVSRNVLHGRWSDNVTYLDGGTGGLNLRVNNSASEGLFINSTSNVGIGTTSPTQKLDVAGTVKATAFAGDGSALTNLPSTGGGVTASTTQSCSVTGSGSCTTLACPAGYFRSGCSASAPNSGSGLSGVGACSCSATSTIGTWSCVVYCLK